ncbi:hypothetical protein LIER_21081 [Lithospermum erythrorhizon]|uniref:BURP domain-containing protein n=1 Tax=Lithospermum erythrorhizon TaxID=34254 RepID=A0AAV3QRC9_LITER
MQVHTVRAGGLSAGVRKSVIGRSPFTPKAALTRYWKMKISNDLPQPSFLLDKASPMNVVQLATFLKLADDKNALSTLLTTFCESANLFCFPDLLETTNSLNKQEEGNVNFVSYQNKNFTNYGTKEVGEGTAGDPWTTGKSLPAMLPKGSSQTKVSTPMATNAQHGAGDFKEYTKEVYIANASFTSYSDKAKGQKQSFETYTTDSNEGDGKFTSYGKNGNKAENDFSNYGKHANRLGAIFSNYGDIPWS